MSIEDRLRKLAKVKGDDPLKDRRVPAPPLNEQGQIRADIVWTSPNGQYVVIEGPFPYGFQRTLTSDISGASGASAKGIKSRSETTLRGVYAKTLAALVIPTHNDYGEYAP